MIRFIGLLRPAPAPARGRPAAIPGAVLACLLPLVLACATAINPVTGEREIVTMTTQQEIAAGRKAAKQVEQQMGLAGTTPAQTYVRSLGERLAPHSPRQDVPYTFQIVGMQETNAFALPGGHIYVSLGLLALVNSEDELANVIAHEIGHVAALHHARGHTRQTGVGLATVLGTIAAGALGGAGAAQAVGQIGQIAGAGLIASYSRDQEREADAVGQAIAARGGWDPGGMTRFLSTLERETRLVRPEGGPPTFLASHPSTPERVRSTAQRAVTLPVSTAAPIVRDRGALLERLEGIRVGPDPAQGLFDAEVFRHPDLGIRLRFPSGWKTQNTPTVVGALEPGQNAMITLEGQGRGSDPKAAGERWLANQRLEIVAAGPVSLEGARAYRVVARGVTNQGQLGVHLTWVVHRGGVYRLTGIAPAQRYGDHKAAFDRTAASFRALSRDERAAIRVKRLRVATARRGESLGALGRRSGNTWDTSYTSLANGLEPGARLSAGQKIKIAVEEPYRSAR